MITSKSVDDTIIVTYYFGTDNQNIYGYQWCKDLEDVDRFLMEHTLGSSFVSFEPIDIVNVVYFKEHDFYIDNDGFWRVSKE